MEKNFYEMEFEDFKEKVMEELKKLKTKEWIIITKNDFYHKTSGWVNTCIRQQQGFGAIQKGEKGETEYYFEAADKHDVFYYLSLEEFLQQIHTQMIKTYL